MKRHLLSAADLTREDAELVLRHRRRDALAGRPADQEAAGPARPDGGQPLLRGLHPHPHLLRGGGQAALGRRHQLLGQGLLALQGRVAQGHRADARGDGLRTPWSSATAPAAPRTGWPTPAGCAPRWSTPATAPTSTPPRRCSTRSPCGATSARATAAPSTASGSRSSATCCTRGWPAPTRCSCRRSAPRSPWSRRRPCCPWAWTPGAWRRRTTSTA